MRMKINGKVEGKAIKVEKEKASREFLLGK